MSEGVDVSDGRGIPMTMRERVKYYSDRKKTPNPHPNRHPQFQPSPSPSLTLTPLSLTLIGTPHPSLTSTPSLIFPLKI